MKKIKGLKILDSKKPGPTLTIMAGVHGNEICGITAFKKIINGIKIKKGKVYFILGNIKAIKKCSRQINFNLNRMFRLSSSLTKKQKESYEYKRSREIIPYLNQSIALLDIHSSLDKNSQPFIVCEKPIIKVAQYLSPKIITLGITKLEPGGTDGYMYNKKKIGICIECGYHKDPKASSVAIDAIYSFLSYFDMLKNKYPIIKTKKKIYEMERIYLTKKDFVPNAKYGDFTPIKKGSVIGSDSNKKIIVKKNYITLFVFPKKEPDKEAFLLGNIIQ